MRNPIRVAETFERRSHASIALCCLHSPCVLDKGAPPILARHRDPRSHALVLRGISKQLGCAPIVTGGIEDHVHLLARMSRTVTQAEWVKELKRVSNLWIKKQFAIGDFEWQGGYADFSVSASNLDRVKKYIERQEEHHRKFSFQNELRSLLQKHHVEWNEKYVWD